MRRPDLISLQIQGRWVEEEQGPRTKADSWRRGWGGGGGDGGGELIWRSKSEHTRGAPPGKTEILVSWSG